MRRSIYSVVIGVLFAAVALFFLFNARTKPATVGADVPVVETTAVLVAAKDIGYGEKILPELSKVVQWPTEAVPAEIVNTRTELFEGPEAPRIALRSLTAGEPFLKAKVSGFGERPILSRKVAEGMRAFSVRINDVSGVAGFILPGDRVDIILTRQMTNAGGGRASLATEVILQNVTVLGIDQMLSETSEEPIIGKSATFEVTSEQAQKLALASQVGTLSLALRNYATLENDQVQPIDVDDLGQRKAAPPPAPKKDPSVFVRVRKGSVVSSEQVAN